MLLLTSWNLLVAHPPPANIRVEATEYLKRIPLAFYHTSAPGTPGHIQWSPSSMSLRYRTSSGSTPDRQPQAPA